MSRPPARTAAADSDLDRAARPEPEPGAEPSPAAAAAIGSLADLPVAGLTRRRIALLIGAILAAWVVVLFARQVGEASEATTRAAEMRASNATLASDVAAAEHELALIQQQAYVQQQAREYRLGHPREIPFILSDDAPALAADAPGSAAVRLGEVADRRTPLESWLDLLFGSPDDAGAAPRAAAG
jgi:cell division protein FtsB